MQLRRGAVSVTNGNSTVRGVYAVLLTGVTGSFAQGEDLFWGSDGIGVVVRHDTIAQKLFFTRASGSAPIPTDGVRNLASTKTGTVLSLASDSTPNFATELAGPGGPKLFSLLESGVFYNATPANADALTLSGAYTGLSNVEAAYAIVRDFETYFFWPVPAPSDIDLASILSRTLAAIGASLYGPAKTTPTLGTNWAHGASSLVQFWKDADRMVHLSGKAVNTSDSVPSTIFTLPIGYRPTYARRFAIVVANTAIGVLEITTGGAATVVLGALNTSVYLDGVSFRGEA